MPPFLKPLLKAPDAPPPTAPVPADSDARGLFKGAYAKVMASGGEWADRFPFKHMHNPRLDPRGRQSERRAAAGGAAKARPGRRIGVGASELAQMLEFTGLEAIHGWPG